MKDVTMFNISEILEGNRFKNNKSKLARHLNIDRRTLSKMIPDIDCELHCILYVNSDFHYFSKGKAA